MKMKDEKQENQANEWKHKIGLKINWVKCRIKWFKMEEGKCKFSLINKLTK